MLDKSYRSFYIILINCNWVRVSKWVSRITPSIRGVILTPMNEWFHDHEWSTDLSEVQVIHVLVIAFCLTIWNCHIITHFIDQSVRNCSEIDDLAQELTCLLWEHMTHVNLKFNLIQIFKTLQNNGWKKQNTFERWTTDITYISKENLRSCVSEKLHETFLIPTPCAKIAWRGSQAGTVVHLQLHEM